MHIKKKNLDGFFEIISEPFIDDRGILTRIYDENIFNSMDLNTKWVQESYSKTNKKNSLRGLHIQFPPFVECKLIKIINGKMLWVVVDLREKSETFGCWESIVLSSDENSSIYVKKGFAHGCISLSDNCDLVILSDNFYSKDRGCGIIWNDPDLNIDWKLNGVTPIMSKNHKNFISFKDFKEKYHRSILNKNQ